MSDEKHKLLIVEDNAGLRRQMSWSFAEDYTALTAGDRLSALSLLDSEEPRVVLLDLGLPPDAQGATEGLATLEAIRAHAPAVKVIVLTGNEDRANALRAVALGAFDFCQKPMDIDVLRVIVQRAMHVQILEEESRLQRQASATTNVANFIAASAQALATCRAVERVAPTDVTVLLLGESGTGKEVLARAVHDLSPRANGPFVAINCGAIPENLMESEMFGHERGAFTGAVKQTIGKFEQAHGGTLFLDEIGDIPLALQVKLLRFLQDRVLERVGGRKTISVDVRIVCATNANLENAIRDGGFREDLFYRLNEFAVRIPALRERPGDAIILARHFMQKYAKDFKRNSIDLSSDALAAISAHDWPGNVRELQARMKRAVLLADGDLVTSSLLDLADGVGAEDSAVSGSLSLRDRRADAERQTVMEALEQSGGNLSQAAKLLRVSRPTLYALLKGHNLAVPQKAE